MLDQSQIPPAAVPEPLAPAAGRLGARSRARTSLRRRSTASAGGGVHFFQVLPAPVWYAAIALAVLGAFSVNPVLTPVAILIVPVLASLLWIPGEPPVLLFGCGMQWLQASVAVFYTNFYGQSLNAMPGGAELTRAIWLSLIGLLVLGIGMRLALIRRKAGGDSQVEREARLLQPPTIFAWYLVAFVVFYFVNRFAWSIQSLAQPILATMTLKWVLVFLLAYSVLSQQRNFALLWLVVCLEFFTGLLGYFSSFKSVFFILLVVLPSARFFFTVWRLAQFCAVGAFVLVFFIVWTVIKSDYREFLNQGTGQQQVLVPVPERIAKLNQLVDDLDRRSFDEGLELMIMRVSYVSYFAMALSHVPESVPYERGGLWFGAVKHVLTPRFLFPNKESIDDSARTEKYTGLEISGAEQGTSISLGYMAESYIDFGPAWMFVPVFLLGLFYGLIYRFFVDGERYRVLGFAMATAILVFGAYTIETSNIKLVGGNLMGLLVMGLFAKVAGPWLWRQITSQPARVGGGRRKQRAKTSEPPGVIPNADDHR